MTDDAAPRDEHAQKLIAIADASRREDGTDIPLGEQCREAAARIEALVAEQRKLTQIANYGSDVANKAVDACKHAEREVRKFSELADANRRRAEAAEAERDAQADKHTEIQMRLSEHADALAKVLENARDTLVFMRVKGSLAIAAFVRGTSDRRERVVEMLDRLDETIAEVCKALGKPE